jgi:hypothetical protein
MKKYLVVLFMMVFSPLVSAQSSDLVQLILDVEKLTQLKGILSDMKTGYSLISGGYNQVKRIASGNLSLHQDFLNGLLAVSPSVSKYGRVGDILLQQAAIVSEYKTTWTRFRGSGTFNADELAYLADVYTTLLAQSLSNLDRLTTILTAGKTRMSDDERLGAIDHIYADTDDKLTFIRHFDQQATILSVQRQKELSDARAIRNLYP